MMKKITVTLALAAAFATASAHAQLANFQFIGQNAGGPVVPTYTGAGVLTGNNTWDPLAANSNGSKAVGATSVTDATTGFTLTIGYTGNYYKQDTAANAISLLQGYVYSSAGAAGTIAFSNLPAGMYTLVLYSQNSTYAASPTSFTLAGTTQAATEGQDTSFAAGVNYVMFTGLTVTNGTLSGTFVGTGTSAEADFNGAQLQLTRALPVPEPSTCALMALGIGAFVLFARRRWAA